MMNELYWPIDPPEGIAPEQASGLLYDEFRNPFAHALGLAVDFDLSTKKRRLRRIEDRIGVKKVKKYNELTEQLLEEWEVSKVRPDFSATITVAERGTILLVDGLYWGTRRLIESLTRDRARMNRLLEFLHEAQAEEDEVQ